MARTRDGEKEEIETKKNIKRKEIIPDTVQSTYHNYSGCARGWGSIHDRVKRSSLDCQNGSSSSDNKMTTLHLQSE